ncbi:MAG: DNA primase, partial [Polyangiaceae bacterium]|nr:DNA primase [Polyangiaceae bacterium]
MIAQETIQAIREGASISTIIGETVALKRKGRSLTGLCPFHQEKSPSFHVNEERGFFHCFGCGESGDVFKFVMKVEGMTFIESVRALGERLGVEVRDDMTQEERRQRDAAQRRKQALLDANRIAANYYQRALQKHQLAHFAHQELRRRGLAYDSEHRAVLDSFGIGYAPDGWDGLVRELQRVGIDLSTAEEAGLVAQRRNGPGYYDRFRHRLIFGVYDLHGQVVAFSGLALPSPRAEEEEAAAKYINSPETPVYKKGSTVFGLYQSRSQLRGGKPCVIVEGNFDVVSLHARGFDYTVAPLGTAFTAEQGKQIRRFGSDAIFLFDGDKAGRKATAASKSPAQEAGLTARVARLPDGQDPDDFSREKGREGLERLLAASKGMLDHLIDTELEQNFSSDSAQSQAEKVKNVAQLIAEERDPTARALAEQHADKLAARLGVNDARTFRALRQAVKKGVASKKEHKNLHSQSSQRSVPERPIADLEKSIIGAILDYPPLLFSDEFT